SVVAFFFFQAEDGIRDRNVTGVQTCALPISPIASITCAAGALGMLAIGVGGLEVAMAMAGQPLYVALPEIWGVELTGDLPDWVRSEERRVGKECRSGGAG